MSGHSLRVGIIAANGTSGRRAPNLAWQALAVAVALTDLDLEQTALVVAGACMESARTESVVKLGQTV